MFDEIFNEKNIKEAFASLTEKNNSCGKDGMMLNEVYEYFELNRSKIIKSITNRKYKCKTTLLQEMLNYKGKKRIIAKMCSIDRLIARAMEQILSKALDSIFSDYSFAYRKNYGVHKAVEIIFDYVKKYKYVCNIDIRSYFDEINHDIMINEAKKVIKDNDVIYLIKCFLKCEIEYDYVNSIKNKGLIQGNSLSPLFSNLYLNSLDTHLEKKNVPFVRFADDLYLFFYEKSEAYNYLNHVKQILNARYLLDINVQKSGVFESKDITYLGYSIIENKDHYEIAKYKREKPRYYSSWYSSPLTYNHHQYHILDDEILRKKDFHLLFENDEQKIEIPVEVTDHINIHSDIIFSSSFFETMNIKKIAVNIFNKQGIYIGQFTPNNKTTNIYTTLNQALCYQDKNRRLNIAKKFVNASIHNERSNIKYYYKKTNKQELIHPIEEITTCLKHVNECQTYEELLLVEARAKHVYYQTIPYYITNPDFHFDQRSKQPPLDNINALISFGNTVLYNLIANEIQKTSLDIRIGFLHASNARKQSLNLDIADVFKPIIIDRVIFTMIHKNIITSKHFENKEHGIYLTKEGKSIFIKHIYNKLYSHIKINNEKGTYYTIIRHNIYSLLQHINKEQKLKLYKYQ